MKTVTTVVIGAGQAGLAMSRELSRRAIDHVVIDRGEVGEAWRRHRWDSLRLLTPNWANALPGAPYRGPDPHGYMRVSELIARFDDYAAAISAPVQGDTTVHRVHGSEGDYRIETSQGPFRCASLVLATGGCARPRVPGVAEVMPPGVFQSTSLHYKRPDDLPPGGVLVVGASASGAQLTREIQASGRPVTLAVGSHIRLPRSYRGRDIEWWLDMVGALDERFDAVENLERARRTPSPQLIGGPDPVDLNALQELGVEVVGKLAGIRDGQALFSGGLASAVASADLKMVRLLDAVDGWVKARFLNDILPPPHRPAPTRLPENPVLNRSLIDGGIRSVLWATGYRPDFSWLELPVFDPRGRLRHRGGVVDVPGVYALGLRFLRRRRSHQISGVGDDARDLADHLAQHLAGARAA